MIKFNKIENFYNNNKGIINSIIVYGVCLIVGKKFGIKIPGVSSFTQDPPQKKSVENDPNRLSAPNNSLERAIVEVWRNAMNSDFDKTRLSCADKISQLVYSEKNVTDATLSYAIIAMGKIANKTDFDCTKSSITDKILWLRKNVNIIEDKTNEPE